MRWTMFIKHNEKVGRVVTISRLFRSASPLFAIRIFVRSKLFLFIVSNNNEKIWKAIRLQNFQQFVQKGMEVWR